MKKAASTAAVILIVVIAFTALPGISNAADYANYEKAVDLQILGLSGSDSGLDFGRTPTRTDGAVMLVRLLGKESKALQAGYKHPFKNVPTWADKYVGYMYQNGLAAGAENSSFNWNDPLSAVQYTAFILRALGYDDFKYQEALDKAVEIGLLTANAASVLKKKSFLKDDMTGISYNALNAKLKGSDRTLLDKLILDDKAIYKPAATILGLYTSDLESEIGNIDEYSPASTNNGYVARNRNDLFLIVRKFLFQNQKQFKVDTNSYEGDACKDFEAVCKRAYEAVKRNTGVDNFLDSWQYQYKGSILTVTFSYNFTKEVFDSKMSKVRQAVNKARQIVSRLIDRKMSDYDKEKILHDYIVNNTRYDVKNYNAGTLSEDTYIAYGSLLKGTAVCQGYSEAVKLLFELAGLECRVVTGESYRSGKWTDHVWNIVKIDGNYYHVDATFDDPVIKNVDNMLIYQYFNLTDNEAARINRWKKSDHPVCNSVKNSYYCKNKLVAGNHKEFVNAVNTAVKQHKTQIELRVSGYTEDKYDLSDILFASNTVSRYQSLINKEFGIVHIYNIQYF